MFDIADVYVWIVQNKWWLWCLVPLVIIVAIYKAGSVR